MVHGVWVQPGQKNKVGFANAFTVGGTQIEAKAGDQIRGITYEQDYIGVALDTDLLTYRSTPGHNPGNNVYREQVSLADLPSRSVLVQNTADDKPTPLRATDFLTPAAASWGEVLVSNGVNYLAGDSDLQWSKIRDLNVADSAGISASKMQNIDAYSFWLNNTNVDDPADEIMTFAPQSVVIRTNTSQPISNLVIGGGGASEQGGFMARPRVWDRNVVTVGNIQDLQDCVFDPDNFGWTGNKVYVGWAEVQW